MCIRDRINAQPGLLPIGFAPDDVQGGRQSLETYQARAQAIRDHAEFRRRISRLLAARFEDQVEPAHVEQRIYSGFASNADLARMHSFHVHAQDWEDRAGRELGCTHHFRAVVRLYHLVGFRRRQLAQGRSRSVARMGPGWPALQMCIRDRIVSSWRILNILCTS